MNRKMRGLPVFFLAVIFAGLSVHNTFAEDSPDPGAESLTDPLMSCSKWMNCDRMSPNYTGVCCRTCKDAMGGIAWDCKEVAVEGETGDASYSGEIPSGEATLTGIVTAKGVLKADDGHQYAIVGSMLQVQELRRNMGKKIEVKGTVKEAKGKVTFEVASYKSMHPGDAGGEVAIGACGGWMNCDQRPPNFTGTCCRQCDDKQGAKVWDCKVFSEGEHFDTAEWSGTR